MSDANEPPRKVPPPAPSRRSVDVAPKSGPVTPEAVAAAPAPKPPAVRIPVVKGAEAPRPLAAKIPAVVPQRGVPVQPVQRPPLPAAARSAKVAAPGPVAKAVEPAPIRDDPEPPSERSHVRGTPPSPESAPLSALHAPSTQNPTSPTSTSPTSTSPTSTSPTSTSPTNLPTQDADADWLSHLLDDTALKESRSVHPDIAKTDSPSAKESIATNPPSAGANPSVSRSAQSLVRRAVSARSERIDRGLCAFWVKDRCFALDVDLVGEIVNIDSVVPVPQSHPAMMGLFNLRGTPVALVDLALALALDDHTPDERPTTGRTTLALVFRSSRMVAAAVIDRMEAVLPAGRETLTLPEATDNPLVKGFVELQNRSGLTITVLHPPAVVERLERLKYI